MTGLDHFWAILGKPDNLPIAGMVVALVFLRWVWWRQVRVNDRLLREGREEEIGQEMRK